MTCNLVSAKGHKYIIVAVDYLNKWVEAKLATRNNGETIAYFMLKNVIAHVGIPKEITFDHGSHFQNKWTIELSTMLRFVMISLPLIIPNPMAK